MKRMEMGKKEEIKKGLWKVEEEEVKQILRF